MVMGSDGHFHNDGSIVFDWDKAEGERAGPDIKVKAARKEGVYKEIHDDESGFGLV